MKTYSEPLANGHIEVEQIADPAAGADFSFTTDNNFTTEILLIRFTLTADANAANRFINIDLSDGTNNILVLPQPTALTANLVGQIAFAQGVNGSSSPINQQWIAPLPTRFTTPGNFVWTSRIQNMQAGDQISDIFITKRRWVHTTI